MKHITIVFALLLLGCKSHAEKTVSTNTTSSVIDHVAGCDIIKIVRNGFPRLLYMAKCSQTATVRHSDTTFSVIDRVAGCDIIEINRKDSPGLLIMTKCTDTTTVTHTDATGDSFNHKTVMTVTDK